MAKKQIPAPPRGTGVNGAKLWRDVLGKYELEEHELALLPEITRTADLLDKLHAITSREGVMVSGPHGSKPHPAVLEARQARIALARLTAALRLPAGDEGNPAAHRRPQRRIGMRGVSPSSPTRLNEDLQPRGAPPPRRGARHRQSARRARRRAPQPLCALAQESDTAMTVLLPKFQS